VSRDKRTRKARMKKRRSRRIVKLIEQAQILHREYVPFYVDIEWERPK
jgi:hypothetical protein